MSIFIYKKDWNFLIKIQLAKSDPKRTRSEKYLPSCQLGLTSSVGNIYYLSVLRPTFGVGAGEASINGIDNSSYSKGFFFISPFWNGAPSSPFPLLTRPFLKYYLRITVQSRFSDTLFSDKSRFSDNFAEDHFFST